MADLRIVDAPLLSTVKGTEKIPTGGEGNFSVSVNQVADFAKLKWFLATEEYVDNAVGNVQADLNLHKNNSSNPHGVTKIQVGLGNVDNTADLDKPVSNATQSAITTANSGKADKSYVDSQDQLKADKTAVEASLSLKADKVDLTASKISSNGNQTQQIINDFGGAKWYDKSGGYELGATVKLENGDIVKSTIPNNTNDPNVNMTGWVSENSAEFTKFGIVNNTNDNLLNRVKIITPYVFGAKGDRVTDDTAAIQAFFNFCAANLVVTADWTGDFLIKADIFADTGSIANWKDKPVYCQNFTGHLTLRSDYASDGVMIELRNFSDTNWNGKLTVIGKGISSYVTRTNGHGVALHNCKKLKFDQIETWYFKGRGLIVSGASTEGTIIVLDQWYCGASAGAASANNLTLTTPTYENIGTSGVNTQRCKVTVGAGTIPSAMQINDYILFFNSAAQYSEAKRVTAIDRATNSFEVYPWVLDSDRAYTPFYVVGGGYYAEGGDTSALTIVKHSTLTCGVGNNSQSLYPIKVLNHISQFNGIASVIGASGSEGGCILSSYYEANGMNDLEAYPSSGVYLGAVAPEAEPWKRSHLQAGILSGANYIRGNATSSRVVQKSGRLPIAAGNQLANAAAQFRPVISTNRPTVVNFTAIQTNGGAANSGIIKLSYDQIMNREYGLDTIELLLHGTGTGGGTTNPVTIQANEAGNTVNGLSEIVLTVSVPTRLVCRYIAGDWKVFAFTANSVARQASVTYDPPSLAAAGTAGDTFATTVTLPGAAIGDTVVAAFNRYNLAVKLYAVVSAANTVTVEFKNTSTSAVDLASGTLTVKLI